MAVPARSSNSGGAPSLQINTGEKYRELVGAERAAVLLLALGEEHGREIWQRLDELEVRQISLAMSKLGPVSPEMLEHLFVDFVTKLSSKGSLTGNFDSTERILMSFLPPERVNAIMEEIRGPAGRNMWEKLSNVQENVLANYLKN
jgi:flagellar motor switch protein FliG